MRAIVVDEGRVLRGVIWGSVQVQRLLRNTIDAHPFIERSRERQPVQLAPAPDRKCARRGIGEERAYSGKLLVEFRIGVRGAGIPWRNRLSPNRIDDVDRRAS